MVIVGLNLATLAFPETPARGTSHLTRRCLLETDLLLDLSSHSSSTNHFNIIELHLKQLPWSSRLVVQSYDCLN